MNAIERLHKAEAAAREVVLDRHSAYDGNAGQALRDLLAALDAARGEAVAWQFLGTSQLDRQRAQWKHCEDPEIAKENGYEVRPLYAAPPAAPAVPADEPGYMAEAARRLRSAVSASQSARTDEESDYALRDLEASATYAARLMEIEAQQPAAAVPANFTEWLAREMPAGTVIGDPQWWANLIARRFAQFAQQPAAAVPASLTAELAARLDKVLGCHADSMPKEAYFEVDAVMRALQAQPPAAAVPEGYDEDEIADACMMAEVPDSKYEAIITYLGDNRRAMLAAANKENNNG